MAAYLLDLKKKIHIHRKINTTGSIPIKKPNNHPYIPMILKPKNLSVRRRYDALVYIYIKQKSHPSLHTSLYIYIYKEGSTMIKI